MMVRPTQKEAVNFLATTWKKLKSRELPKTWVPGEASRKYKNVDGVAVWLEDRVCA